MIVDDSAVVRGVFGRILDAAPDVTVVTTAPNGQLALAALRRQPVDVVLLDVEMPELDGLATLPLLVEAFPGTHVIMASSLTHRGADVTLQALALGAADYIGKPSARTGAAALQQLADDLVRKVRALGRGRPRAGAPALLAAPPSPAGAASIVLDARPGARPRLGTILGGRSANVAPRVVAIAASTGGPNALAAVLGALPADFALPILITQHMPPVFTQLLAQRLARDSGRSCVEASDGLPIRPGCAYVAPGDFHLVVATHEGAPIIRLSQAAPENFCRPAADAMLRATASVFGATTIAIVLTGMGEDGRRGCEAVHRAGGRVLVQDEDSSVVWGMPGAVARAGLADEVLPLGEIAARLRTLTHLPVSPC